MDEPPVVLHVDDDDRRRDRVASALSAVSEDVSTIGVDDVETGLSWLADGVDAVICAYALPGRDGLALVEAVHDRDPDIPVVMFAAEGDERVASEAIDAGVTDYVPTGGEEDARRAGRSVLAALDERVARREDEDDTGGGETDESTDATDGDLPETPAPSPALASLVRAFDGGADDRVRMPPLVEALGDPVYVVDDQGYLRLVNDAFVERFGYSRATLLDTHLSIFLDDEAYDRGTRALLETVDSDRQRHATFEFTGQTAGGTEVVAEVNATPLTEAGEFVGSVGTLRDITERTRREERLETYGTLVETVSDPMFKLDELGTIDMLNDAMVDFAGYDREELIGMHFTEFLDADEIEEGEEIVTELLSEDGADTATHDFSSTTKAGEVKVVENSLTVLTDEDGEYSGSVGVLRDVTEREERERELAQYETLMETVPMGMFTVDENGVLTWVNDECYELLDVDPETVEERYLDQPYLKLVDDGFFDVEHVEEYLNYVREMLSSETETRKAIHDVYVHRSDGTDRIVDAHSGLLPMEDGEFRGTVTAFRDVTKQKQYERELERQNERLERFASVVSHDLRNPLTVAQGHLDVAKTVDNPTDSLEEIGVSLDRMEELIDDVLALARQGQSVAEPAPVELGTVVDEAWETVETTEATLRNDATGTVAADQSRLRQLLENCFRNAIEHGSTSPRSQAHEDSVEHGSTIPDSQTRRDTAGQASGEPSVASAPDDAVEHADPTVTVTVGDLSDGFSIEDDGPGIPDDRKDEVFELGYTTEPDGTGFGLGIVSEIVDAHGWEIRIVDAEDGGARFEITDVDAVETIPSSR
mgnify:FL=1